MMDLDVGNGGSDFDEESEPAPPKKATARGTKAAPAKKAPAKAPAKKAPAKRGKKPVVSRSSLIRNACCGL